MSATRLKVAIVGPTHPFKGGIAAHTATLAHKLAEAGHDVHLYSWTRLYPLALYPGEQELSPSAIEVEPFRPTLRSLSWARPDTWVRTGLSLRGFDLVIVVHVVPATAVSHAILLRAARTTLPTPGRTARCRPPAALAIAHNVVPHEARSGDLPLTRLLFRSVDHVLVHSVEQDRLAQELGARRTLVAPLPPHFPGGPPVPRQAAAPTVRLLALGIVRDYKGLDLLLEAMRGVPGASLTVAGEMWGRAAQRVRELAALPELAARVQLHEGYVPADRIAHLMSAHDVVVLPYRSATASQNVLLAFRHGLPVLASSVGTFASQVTHGVDGLVVPPGDVAALQAALTHLTAPGLVAELRSGVRPPDEDPPWRHYVEIIESAADRL